MLEFPKDEYLLSLGEIRERLLSAEALSKERNIVVIESTALQIRQILEIIAHLSILVNLDKLNHREKNEWHAQKVIDALSKKTTVFYPLPSHIVPPKEVGDQPTMIPLGYGGALSEVEFSDAYSKCGRTLHAQHPLKKKVDIESVFLRNKNTLMKVKALLKSIPSVLGMTPTDTPSYMWSLISRIMKKRNPQ